MSRRTDADVIVDYVLRQRENGWLDGQIREHMEITKGHTPEMLNNYFHLADKKQLKKNTIKMVIPITAIFLLVLSVFFLGRESGITGAAPWDWGSWGSGSWKTAGTKCGDSISTTDIFDMSSCIADTDSTKENIFCYVNASIDTNDLLNKDWYDANLGFDITSSSAIDSVSLLQRAIVLPWDAVGSSISCFEWNYGRAKSSKWHQCIDTDDDGMPENLVFYYNDITSDDAVGIGHLSTTLTNDGSYYLCYDELSCETQKTTCDTGEYCVGRLDTKSGSAWYPCDTTASASYYRCCTGSCTGTNMQCGEKILSSDKSSSAPFAECVEDDTSACCSNSNACVYNGECYNLYDSTEIGGITMECSASSHWCPKGFVYDVDFNWCKIEQTACYDPSDTDYCNYIVGVDSMDDWEADTDGSKPCIKKLTTSTSTAYYEGCIWQEVSGMDFYFYQNVEYY